MRRLLTLVCLLAFLLPAAFGRATDVHERCADLAKSGFVQIFNGRDLGGWDGDPAFWYVRDGVITAEVKPGVRVKNHSYLIWQGAKVRDFELHVLVRSTSGNSGIDYRAEPVRTDKAGEPLRWTIQGYQSDIANGWMGSLYNWGKAGAQPGQFVVVSSEETAEKHVGSVVDRQALSEVGYYKPGKWNQYTIVARSSHILHRINNYLVVEFIDNGPETRREGVLGLQVHSGQGPFLNEFKDICLSQYNIKFGQAKCLFNGKDFAGWTFSDPQAKSAWKVEDAALIVRDKSRSYIYTMQDYANYVLRFQYRGLDKAESGVALRLRPPRESQPTKGILIYGSGGDFDRIDPIGRFSLTVPRLRALPFRRMPPGFWNECEIILNGGQLSVTVNGILRATAVGCEELAGRIGLQAPSAGAQFRNIVLIPIL